MAKLPSKKLHIIPIVTALQLSGLITLSPVSADTLTPHRAAGSVSHYNLSSSSTMVLKDGAIIARFGDHRKSFGELTRTYNSYTVNGASISGRSNVSTRLSYSYASGKQAWHFSGLQSNDEQNINVGITSGRSTIVVSTGEGSSTSWKTNTLYGFNNSYKNGFQPAPHSYTGLSLAYQVTPDLYLNTGGSRIRLNGRIDPYAYYASFSYKRLSGHFSAIQRNGFTLANGMQLSYSAGPIKTRYNEYKNFRGFTLRRIQLELSNGKRGDYAFNLESGTSPFTGIRDNRFLISYKIRNRTPGIYHAAEKENKTGEEGAPGQGGFNTTAMVVGGVAVLAAAAGSSSGNGDGAPGGFPTQNGAAFFVLNGINPTSVAENREYGGWIYRIGDGSFSSTTPVAGEVASVNIGDPVTSVPPNTTASASYHTHAGPDPRFINESFSPTDINIDNLQGVDGYLGTPGAKLLFHNRLTGEISQIGTIAI
ncbi:MAG: DUF4329 domain-containing protein [Gammaproteobacteria bacterium]|nr:DUF4329 domain-containing protein [Gammaproteobacteria bacterium]